ncbi:MAG: DNA-protecting protein DprA, partial [Nitrospinae bacterium]|nr:DNA-protecting protein DprA [Nitrospinota bacterium]
MEERYWWIGLNCVPGVGSITSKRLIEAFGTPKHVFSASQGELRSVDGVGGELARRIATFPVEEVLEREVAAVERAGITLCTLHDEDYPPQLATLYDPPPVLYVRGALMASDALAIAVVGSRRPTAYGRSVAERLAGELASLGFTVVSGLARGIDGLAHQAALSAGGRTLAVYGNGIDLIFPSEHRELADAIAERGALISEFPMGVPPVAHNFPRRNRIIAGLALGTVVVEAAAKSGSLITARCALEQGREVFAVPGPVITGNNRGAHRLIKQGATLVEGVEDIIDALPLHFRAMLEEGQAAEGVSTSEPEPANVLVPPAPRVSASERALLALIQEEPRPIDRMIEESGLAPSAVSGLLVQLELKGLVA